MATEHMNGDRDTLLERAAEQAIELRKSVDELADRGLRDLIDVVLMEIGIRLAAKLPRRPP